EACGRFVTRAPRSCRGAGAAEAKAGLREQRGRSAGGEGLAWTRRGDLRPVRADHAQADDDRAYGIIDSGVDGADGAGDEEDDVVPVVVVVETGNPHRVRGTGMGNGRQREQDAQEQDSERRPATHGPRPYAATPTGARARDLGLPTFALTRRPRALRFTGDHRKPRRIQCRSSSSSVRSRARESCRGRNSTRFLRNRAESSRPWGRKSSGSRAT